MAFKTAKEYNEARFGNMFLLRNDGDSADVIFLYRNSDDVLVADTHYIKSANYSGYAHCCGIGCPVCQKNIRVQSKLFIPMYNITEGKIQFWDRSMRFEPQLQKDVFEMYPDPCRYVFRITRHGVAGSIDTTYEIQAVATNTVKSFDEILAEAKTSYPECYSEVCKELSASEMSAMLNSSAPSEDLSDYKPIPRVAVPTAESFLPDSNPTNEPVQPEYVAAPSMPYSAELGQTEPADEVATPRPELDIVADDAVNDDPVF